MNKKETWVLVTEILQGDGIMKDVDECKRKWNNLIRTYRSVKDNQNKTGRAPLKFEYFDAIDEILGNRDSNQGIGVSIGLPTKSSVVETTVNFVEVADPELDLSEPRIKRKKMSAKDRYYDFKKSELEKTLENREKFETSLLAMEKKKIDLLQTLVHHLTNE